MGMQSKISDTAMDAIDLPVNSAREVRRGDAANRGSTRASWIQKG